MRMPRRALRLTRCVVDLAHLVHVNEGVEAARVDTRERPIDRESPRPRSLAARSSLT